MRKRYNGVCGLRGWSADILIFWSSSNSSFVAERVIITSIRGCGAGAGLHVECLFSPVPELHKKREDRSGG